MKMLIIAGGRGAGEEEGARGGGQRKILRLWGVREWVKYTTWMCSECNKIHAHCAPT